MSRTHGQVTGPALDEHDGAVAAMVLFINESWASISTSRTTLLHAAKALMVSREVGQVAESRSRASTSAGEGAGGQLRSGRAAVGSAVTGSLTLGLDLAAAFAAQSGSGCELYTMRNGGIDRCSFP